jgi:hypothetical protein
MNYKIINTVCAVLLMLFLVGCKPNVEQQARVDEQRREHDLNTILSTDPDANIDTAKYVRFKRGGKFFIGPKEYGFFNGSASFYWPSKTPHHAITDHPEKADVQAGNFSLVSINFYVESKKIGMNTYDLVENAGRDGLLIKREKIRQGLERLEIRRAPTTKSVDVFYVANEKKLPLSAQPPTISCSEGSSLNGAGTRFMWKAGLSIYVTFSSAHCKDWPEIYTEIIRVLNLVKEA